MDKSAILTLVQRIPGTQEIDVQGSLHLIAKELIAAKDEEHRIRTSRRYRTAIKAILQGGVYMPRGELVMAAIKRMKVKPQERDKVIAELWEHIQYNRKNGYLTWQSKLGVALK